MRTQRMWIKAINETGPAEVWSFLALADSVGKEFLIETHKGMRLGMRLIVLKTLYYVVAAIGLLALGAYVITRANQGTLNIGTVAVGMEDLGSLYPVVVGLTAGYMLERAFRTSDEPLQQFGTVRKQLRLFKAYRRTKGW